MKGAQALLFVLALGACTQDTTVRNAPPARDTSAAPSGPAARKLSGWKFEHGADGDRVTLQFAADDGTPAAPAGPIATKVERPFGVVRFRLPRGIDETAVTDTVLDAGLFRRAYVVRTLADRSLFVDVHTSGPVTASMAPRTAPSEWTVNVIGVGGAWPVEPAWEQRVVVLEPRPGASLDSVVRISGYARVFESNVVAKLTPQAGAVVDTFTTAADWSSAWGEFQLSLPARRGRAQLFVGEYSAMDGSPQGVVIPVRGR